MCETELKSFMNSEGKFIYLLYDFVSDENRPLIIIPCQFERSMIDNIYISRYLINNGYNVLRYDNTNHVGISEGEHIDHTPSSAYKDFHDVISYVRDSNLKYSSIGVLGISLATRILIKYFSENCCPDIKLFISLVGVINLGDTLERITGEDISGGNLNGKIYGIRKIIKYPINWDNYLSDANKNQYMGLEKSIEEIHKIQIPTILICSENDDWVNINDYFKVFENDFNCIKEKFFISGAAHKLSKNPEAAELALIQIIKSFNKYIKNDCVRDKDIYKPIITEIIAQNKKERKMEMEILRKNIKN